MSDSKKSWFYLIVLSLIWGSSFILIKKSLVGLSPVQVGALRLIITSIALFSVGFKSLLQIKREHYKPIVITALLGTFIPAYLFAFAINGIDSSISSILNSLTPLNTLIVGALLFGFRFTKNQKIGVLIGFIGTAILILSSAKVNTNQNYFYAILPVIASILYALNVNILKQQLKGVSALSIATGNFAVLFIPALIILYFSDFFATYQITDKSVNTSLLYLLILSVFGTALAKTMFNRLVQIASPLFSSSVTYLIPVIAVMWGVLDGEKFVLIQILASFIIFGGVFLSGRK
ncbi:MAG: DMT family transporter [Flavobacteriaceae bacterium]|nr:DMT family transporter [Flavobacteriaceae bacterium]